MTKMVDRWKTDDDVLMFEVVPPAKKTDTGVLKREKQPKAESKDGPENRSSEHIQIAARSFTTKAILGAKDKIAKNTEDQKRTAQVIAKGAELRRSGFSSLAARDFSQAVCSWAHGPGRRVWSNLVRHNGDRLMRMLAIALQQADAAKTAGAAIKPLLSIKGLGVSFASKHLRMLDPTRFAVLDSVLSEELGYALNPNGYSLFMREMLRALAELRSATDVGFERMSVADLERAVFVCVRK